MDRRREEEPEVSAPGRGLQLDDVVLLGRTFAEYSACFALGDDTLRGARVLDAAAGVSSFAAEARERGYDVQSVDPIYGASAESIESKCRADLADVAAQLPSVAHKYVWGGFYRDVPDLVRHREAAYRAFLADYRTSPGRYVPAALPETPLLSQGFSLTLCSHLLFLYDDRLDYDFHRRSVLELVRLTAGEIRIYPLVGLTGEASPFVRRLQDDEALRGLTVEIRPVGFEFLRGAREMMVIETRG